MTDAIFAEPRLAAVYDTFDGERDDLDAYVALVDELGARSVLDVGCGTGSLACLLAVRGLEVVGLDPAEASLDVARRKPGADRARWVHGDAAALDGAGVGPVDLVTMTGNVAQVFLTDETWATTLAAAHAALRPGGRLVFEVRDPDREAWRTWDRARSFRRARVPGVGEVEAWVDVTEVRPPLVSFRWTFVFTADGATLTSDSTLRFRSRAEVAASLAAAGFALDEVRDAPDRPGAELVFLARRQVPPRPRRPPSGAAPRSAPPRRTASPARWTPSGPVDGPRRRPQPPLTGPAGRGGGVSAGAQGGVSGEDDDAVMRNTTSTVRSAPRRLGRGDVVYRLASGGSVVASNPYGLPAGRRRAQPATLTRRRT